MDRKSKQKIISVALLLVFLAAMGIVFACGWKQEQALRNKQREELEIIYPEIKEELEWNFEFYQKESLYNHGMYFFAGIVILLFSGTGAFLLFKKEKMKQKEQIQEKVDWVYEQLHRFHQGDFRILAWNEEIDEQDCWRLIHEKTRELGYFFSDMKERLAEEENNTKALITDISHQLKTPLASIRMCHDLSGSEVLTQEERTEFLKTEAREIEKLEMLLDELVKLSRLENNMIKVKPERSGLKQTISEAVSQVFMKAYEKQIEISVEMENDIEVVHDRKWTVEALTNILENAVKYSGTGTSITIRVQPLLKNILVEVEDDGIGIPEEELHKIFRRFYRGTQAKEKVKDGAGVGLYLARSIIEQQGGTILAKRKPEKGSIFNIILPLD